MVAETTSISSSVIEKLPTGYLSKRDERPVIDLYDEYAAALYSYILRIMRDREKAADILRFVFLNVPTTFSREGDNDPGVFISLLNSARNTCIDALIEANSAITINNTNDRCFGMNSSAIQSFLVSLPVFEKTVLSLLYYRGFTGPEISDLLKVPESIVATKMQSALKQLQSLFPPPKAH